MHAGERGGGGGCIFLVFVLLRFFLFLIASHLTFRHGDLQIVAGRFARGRLYRSPVVVRDAIGELVPAG